MKLTINTTPEQDAGITAANTLAGNTVSDEDYFAARIDEVLADYASQPVDKDRAAIAAKLKLADAQTVADIKASLDAVIP